MVDLAVSTAYRPPVEPSPHALPPPSPYQVLAGDMHCHVAPPDSAPHVERGLEETADLASREGLDFVVLTPHVWARFFEDETQRRRVLEGEADLERRVAALPPSRTTFVVGFEYTDGLYGHVGASFGNLSTVLDALPIAESRRHPEAFFERYVASGGVLVVHHPFATPTHSLVSISNADLSWKPFLAPGPFPPEIEAVRHLARGFEAFNLTVSEVRDHFLYLDRDRSIRQTLARVDEEILAQRRPLFPAGGSDSHAHSLRATTFVLAKGRGSADIREALLAGRTCVRSPAACTFEARPADGAWSPPGTVLRDVARVEVRAGGKHIEVLRNGVEVGHGGKGDVVWVDTPLGECSVLRAAVDEGFSAPIYANCGF
jgi:hypothetical protein